MGTQSLLSVEEMSSAGAMGDIHCLEAEETIELFNKFHTKHVYDPNLAITSYRDKVLSIIVNFYVVSYSVPMRYGSIYRV